MSTVRAVEPFEMTDEVKASVDRLLDACETLDRRVAYATHLIGKVCRRLEKIDEPARKPEAARTRATRSSKPATRRSAQRRSINAGSK